MSKLAKETLVPKIIKTPILIAWMISVLSLLIAVVYYITAQPELPIFYSLARKSDQLAKKEFLFIFPLLSFTLNLLNLLVIKVLKNYSALMLKLFTYTTTVLQFLLLVALIRIVVITI